MSNPDWALELAKHTYDAAHRGGDYGSEEFVTEGYGFYDDMVAAFAAAVARVRRHALCEAADLAYKDALTHPYEVGDRIAELIDKEPK